MRMQTSDGSDYVIRGSKIKGVPSLHLYHEKQQGYKVEFECLAFSWAELTVGSQGVRGCARNGVPFCSGYRNGIRPSRNRLWDDGTMALSVHQMMRNQDVSERAGEEVKISAHQSGKCLVPTTSVTTLCLVQDRGKNPRVNTRACG